MPIRGKNLVYEQVKIRLVDETQFKERQPCQQFCLCRLIMWKSDPDQKHAIDMRNFFSAIFKSGLAT